MEKSEQIKNLKLLAELLEVRDKVYLEHTRAILDLLAPTLLTAVVNFFGIDQKQVQWHEIKTYNASIMLLATVILDPDPATLGALYQEDGPLSDEDLDNLELRKVVRITIPAALSFETVENIIMWLEKQEIQHVEQDMMLGQANQGLEEDGDEFAPSAPGREEIPISHPVKTSASGEFDPGELSKEQIAQMLFFQHQSKGTKQ